MRRAKSRPLPPSAARRPRASSSRDPVWRQQCRRRGGVISFPQAASWHGLAYMGVGASRVTSRVNRYPTFGTVSIHCSAPHRAPGGASRSRTRGWPPRRRCRPTAPRPVPAATARGRRCVQGSAAARRSWARARSVARRARRRGARRRCAPAERVHLSAGRSQDRLDDRLAISCATSAPSNDVFTRSRSRATQGSGCAGRCSIGERHPRRIRTQGCVGTAPWLRHFGCSGQRSASGVRR